MFEVGDDQGCVRKGFARVFQIGVGFVIEEQYGLIASRRTQFRAFGLKLVGQDPLIGG